MTYPQKTLPELLAARARQHGPRTFLLFQEERLSYAGLEEEASRVARVLEALGVTCKACGSKPAPPGERDTCCG